MSKLRILCFLVICGCVLTNHAAAQEKPSPEPSSPVNAETKGFESKEGNFWINISGSPFYTRNLGKEKIARKWVDGGKQFFWMVEKKLYTVMYAAPFDSDEEMKPLNLEMMNSGISETKEIGKLTSEKEIAYGAYPGKEFRHRAASGAKFILRSYLIEKTGYILAAVYADEKDEKAALEVPDSFRLLTENK